jgi:hypothetical protein
MNIQEVDAMTVQQAIEYSLDNLVMQGKQCMLNNDCAYADGKGNHCAIGWLLDANNRGLMLFAGGARALSAKHRDCVPLLIHNNREVFDDFQHFHDVLSKEQRESARYALLELGIDTSHPNFQAWVDLGE